MRNRTDSSQGPAGLDAVIDGATRQNLCTRWYCTTCGARPFRELVAHHLNAKEPLAQDRLRQLGKELSELDRIKNEEATEFLILWAANGIGQSELATVFGDGVVGRHYAKMLRAKAEHDEARLAHQRHNDPEFVQANRLKKREAKAAAHAERLKQKAIRDVEWRRKNEKS